MKTGNVKAFRGMHPKGRNFVVISNQPETVTRKLDGMELVLTNARELISLLH